MKVLVVALLALVAGISARTVTLEDVLTVEETTAYNYHEKVGIPLAEKIRAYEDKAIASRISNGWFAGLHDHPYQCHLLITLPNGATSVCTCSLLTPWRALTATHCWLNRFTPAREMTVIAGTEWLFHYGVRHNTRDVVTHHGWNPNNLNNDIAIARTAAFPMSASIGTIPIATGGDQHVGRTATASGVGGRGDGQSITGDQRVSAVNLRVISNNECAGTYGWDVVRDFTLCTSGEGGRGVCGGDSGGPLTTIDGSNRRVQIGVTCFAAAAGCSRGYPSGYVRVSSFESWIRSLI